MNKALRLIDPITLILTEAEIWPNLVSKANKRNVKVSIINARLSNRSESRYKRFSFFSAPVLRMLNLVCVQDEADIKKNLIFFKSPIGKALIGKDKNEMVTVSTPSGEKNFEILDVEYI